MIKDVISDSYKGEYSIEVTFEDGAIGIVLSLSQNNSDVKKFSQEVGCLCRDKGPSQYF